MSPYTRHKWWHSRQTSTDSPACAVQHFELWYLPTSDGFQKLNVPPSSKVWKHLVLVFHWYIYIASLVGRPVIWRFKQFGQFPINPFPEMKKTKQHEEIENTNRNRKCRTHHQTHFVKHVCWRCQAGRHFQKWCLLQFPKIIIEVWTCILARKRNQSKIQSLSLSCALQENQTCELILVKQMHASAFDSPSSLTSSNSWKHLPAKSWEFPGPDSFSSLNVSKRQVLRDWQHLKPKK